MSQDCMSCLNRELLGGETCDGIAQTLSVSTGAGEYFIQVCQRQSLSGEKPRFREIVANGAAIIAVHQTAQLTMNEAISIARDFDI